MSCAENISVNEASTQVVLRDLLNQTVKQLIKSLEKDFFIFRGRYQKYFLINKWDFDSSSKQFEYKQLFEDLTTTDASIFVTYLVPVNVLRNRDEQQRTGLRITRDRLLDIVDEYDSSSFSNRYKFRNKKLYM
ncbi:hypothetical protein AVEN_66528-1 [Araneus ventricosus]|uniref:Uncharacterized protein n=1 Tax=Araneus ventricosus TaxID=182803 RepID=A0A4Y2EAY4_ARAVE|nr:hypothetical protein AVEN_66528-1 [Araneus ventricosus]